jgi:single-stranded-DNA-specific exonuclease
MSSFLTELLEHYHLSLQDLSARRAPGSFAALKRPDGLPAFENVIARLEKAIASGEKTVIYGDYDVDGLTATAILKTALDERGLKPGFFIPSRYVEGYGLNSGRIDEFHAKGYTLILTVDNGVSALSEIEKAKSLGMEVLVIDHHEAPEKLPDTPYLFHQTLSGFLPYNCSAASLAYFVAARLLGKDDSYLATLAGIAVFSDVMPLVGNNLVFAKLALASLNTERFANLASLLPALPATYEDLSFTLIPSLNSPGRIAKDSLATNNVCRFLLARDDPKAIARYRTVLLSFNEERKTVVKNVAFNPKKTLESDHGSVLCTDSYPGLSGLFANKVMREKNRPVAVFAPEEKDPSILSGSLRCPDPYHVDTFLEKNRSRFLSAGGHAKAAGLRIKAADYYQVATLFLSECEKQALESVKKDDDGIAMVLEDLNAENYAVYESFFPFGEGFEAPVFSLSAGREEVTFSQNRNAAFVYSADHSGKAVYFGDLSLFGEERYTLFTFQGRFRKETYNGKVSYSLFADKVIPEI